MIATILRYRICCLTLFVIALTQFTCSKSSVGEFIAVSAPVIVLSHVRVIDGTGAAAKEDQTIVIEQGRIKTIGSASSVELPRTAKVLDLQGRTAMPGLVGMHDHLFYTMHGGKSDVPMDFSFARLYLACGVTTIRTAAAVDFAQDRSLKDEIAKGTQVGPEIHLTSPYINHPANQPLDLSQLSELMGQWVEQGATSFKVYTNVSRTELAAVIAAAHSRRLKVAGHICAIGFSEAAELGIDSLEHGLLVDTEFYSHKEPDVCPSQNAVLGELVQTDVKGSEIQAMIHRLVAHHVAVTSTLPVFETFIGNQFQLDPRMQETLSPDSYRGCLADMEADRKDPDKKRLWQLLLKKEMEFEREFVKAGGLLMAGVDPTGWGGVIAGFGDQRGVELLVAAGFSPEEAIKIASANGAEFLGESNRIGTLTVGKQADIVIVRGNPASNISEIKNVEFVFKNGVGYDSMKLIASVRGLVGVR